MIFSQVLPLFRGSKAQVRNHIQTINKRKWYCIVNFLYFAQAMKFKVYEDEVQSDYKTALQNSDIICIDGIAMQIFDQIWQRLFWKQRKRPENLNGTDFLPYILEQTQNQKIGIIMSTVYDPKIDKWTERMDKWLDALKQHYPHIDIIFKHQTLFSKRGEDFPIKECIDTIKKKKSDYDHILFLNGIGWPVQEIRTEHYKKSFEHTHIIIMNNGATLDYYSWFETRAPKRVVRIRIGETLRRVIMQPQKNLKKLWAMFGIIPYRRYLITTSIKKHTKKQ